MTPGTFQNIFDFNAPNLIMGSFLNLSANAPLMNDSTRCQISTNGDWMILCSLCPMATTQKLKEEGQKCPVETFAGQYDFDPWSVGASGEGWQMPNLHWRDCFLKHVCEGVVLQSTHPPPWRALARTATTTAAKAIGDDSDDGCEGQRAIFGGGSSDDSCEGHWRGRQQQRRDVANDVSCEGCRRGLQRQLQLRDANAESCADANLVPVLVHKSQCSILWIPNSSGRNLAALKSGITKPRRVKLGKG